MSTTSEANKELMLRFLDAINSRRLDAYDEFLAPNAVRHCQATPGLDIRSAEQFKAFMRQDAATFPDSVQTFHQLVAEGDRVAVWASYEGTQLGQMGPFPASGRKVRFDFAGVFRLEGGKIAEWWLTWDNMAILAQLGHVPAG